MWKYHRITLVEHRASPSFLFCPLPLLIFPSFSFNPLCVGYNKNKNTEFYKLSDISQSKHVVNQGN